MSRREREFDNKNKVNTTSIVIMIIIITAAIIAVTISYVMFGTEENRTAKVTNVQRISEDKNGMLNTITNNDTTETSEKIGKSVNEMSKNEISNNVNGIIEKRAINTNKVENNKNIKNDTNKKVATSANNTKKDEQEKTSENIKKETKDPNFAKPVDGDVIKDYSSENLQYSNTLQEWAVHLGIDYAAEKTSIVRAAADGKVKSIKNDPRYGLTVVLEHTNGFTSMYANLLSTEFITVGEEVKQGQTIATVGNTATFEIADQTHLHFEILKDGNSVDPNIYLK